MSEKDAVRYLATRLRLPKGKVQKLIAQQPAYLAAQELENGAKQTEPFALIGTAPPASGENECTAHNWQNEARSIADEIDRTDAESNAYDSKTHIAERVAERMRDKKIHGPRGPLSGATILREALQAGKWKRKR
jgi:hypothetical protein